MYNEGNEKQNNREKELEEQEIKFKFTYSEDYKKIASNRVWGGLQSGGFFEISFILESSPIPETVTKAVTEEYSKEIGRTQSEYIIRENQATVYLPIETLISFHNWLGEKIEEMSQKGIIKKKME